MKKRLTALGLLLCLLGCLLPSPGVRGAWTAVPSRHAFTVDGRYVRAEVYNIGGNNYFKLRDMAMLLKDTDAHFSVEYDSPSKTIIVGTGIDYEPVGGELSIGVDKSATCVPARHALKVNGQYADVQAYNLGGNNFYKLRDLGRLLHFYVGYDSVSDTAMIVSAYYVRRTDVSIPDENVSVWYEVPVFRGNTPAVRSINADLQSVEAALAQELQSTRSLVSSPRPEDNLHHTWTATVDTFTDRLVSVTLAYDVQLGGTGSSGYDGFVYDAATGGRLFLSDVLGGTEEAVKASVAKALGEQYPELVNGAASDPRSTVRSMNVLDLDFSVVNGHAVVYFDQYEISYGAAGALRVILSEPLVY